MRSYYLPHSAVSFYEYDDFKTQKNTMCYNFVWKGICMGAVPKEARRQLDMSAKT